MGLFNRKKRDRVVTASDPESLEELERNPELLAAEADVNELPPRTGMNEIVRDR